jgi:hypothetical protein
MPQTAVISGLIAIASGVPVLTTQPTNSTPWWLALIISGMGAAGTAFGSLLSYLGRRRRDKMIQATTAANFLAAQQAAQYARLSKEIGRLDMICQTQQEQIDGRTAKYYEERYLKYECFAKLQKLQMEKEELELKLLNCGSYINELELKLRSKNAGTHNAD